MKKFVVYNPTRLHFGIGSIDDLNKSLEQYGKKALVIIGKKSARKHGYFDKVKRELHKAAKKLVTYEGIKSNPVIDDVYKIVDLCNKEKIDFIIALGGGSVIDTAKIVSLAYASGVDPWEMVTYKQKALRKVPVIVVLTIAATGSEMNPFAVIQNSETLTKIGYYNPLNYPDESFLDPTFTLTVPRDHTIYGIVDLIVHSLEAFFAKGDDATLNDKYVGAVIREAIEYGSQLINDLKNISLREKIMWAATNALNGLLFYGRETNGDWGTHNFAHNLSVLYDTPHGASLSIVLPAWMKTFKDQLHTRLEQLGSLVFLENLTAEDVIDKFENLFKELDAPTRVSELGIKGEDEKKRFYEQILNNRPQGFNITMTEDDYQRIIDFMWE